MKALLSLATVTWLLGAAIFRLPAAKPERRAALPFEERLFWSIMIGLAVSLSIVLALAAAHRYSFTRLLVADVLLAAGAAAVAILRGGPRPARVWPGPGALVPIALAIVAAMRFAPPAEYVIGGKDPGVYINAGVQIAQRGTLQYHDPVVAAVPPAAREMFIPQDINRPYFIAPRFMGFFVLDPDRGTVVSQFPHVFPASIAIGYGVAGLTGARWTVTAWAVMGLLAVYFVGARLFGRTAAAAAVVLLALNVIEVWFARYPNAEVAMQTLLFSALLANARAHVDDDEFFAPVAGLLLGLLLFLRVDTLIPLTASRLARARGHDGRPRPLNSWRRCIASRCSSMRWERCAEARAADRVHRESRARIGDRRRAYRSPRSSPSAAALETGRRRGRRRRLIRRRLRLRRSAHAGSTPGARRRPTSTRTLRTFVAFT